MDGFLRASKVRAGEDAVEDATGRRRSAKPRSAGELGGKKGQEGGGADVSAEKSLRIVGLARRAGVGASAVIKRSCKLSQSAASRRAKRRTKLTEPEERRASLHHGRNGKLGQRALVNTPKVATRNHTSSSVLFGRVGASNLLVQARIVSAEKGDKLENKSRPTRQPT